MVTGTCLLYIITHGRAYYFLYDKLYDTLLTKYIQEKAFWDLREFLG